MSLNKSKWGRIHCFTHWICTKLGVILTVCSWPELQALYYSFSDICQMFTFLNWFLLQINPYLPWKFLYIMHYVIWTSFNENFWMSHNVHFSNRTVRTNGVDTSLLFINTFILMFSFSTENHQNRFKPTHQTDKGTVLFIALGVTILTMGIFLVYAKTKRQHDKQIIGVCHLQVHI